MTRPNLDGSSRITARIVSSRWVTSERVGGEGILHDERSGQVHILNASATRVWDLCAGRPTVSELVADLARSYGMPVDAVREDVLALLADLRTRGLLESPEHPDL
jgi:PqqD family protein of HPr-rel-A system